MVLHRLRYVSMLLVAVLCSLVFSPLLRAQGLEYVKANYTKHEYQIPMRDGVRLFTAVYTPKDASQRYPMLMIRTQSGVRPYGTDQYPNDLGPSPLFGKEGYIFVYQDIRGRFMSEGTFVVLRPHNPTKKSRQDIDESSDTYDTIDWLIKNIPNHNGKVGHYGTSYRGFLVACGMIDAHPALVAATPQAPIVDWFMGDDWHRNGALILNHTFNYMPLMGKTRLKLNKAPYTLFDYGTPDGYEFFLRLGPIPNIDARYYKGEVPFWDEFVQHATYDEFWKLHDLRPHLKNIKPAVLTVGGWYDAENLFGVMEAYHQIERASPGATHTLVMGPWLHGGWNAGQADGSSLGHVSFNAKTADFYREKIELPFFDLHLKGKGQFKPPEAWVFETGRNQWREHATWPPKGAKPFELYFREKGRLATEPDKSGQEDSFDEYVSDPAKPVPYIDKIGTRLMTDYMVADQRFAARRPDVLVYETEVLEEDVTLVGPLVADLHVSTSGTDSDWIVKLIDVYPDDFPDPNPNPSGVHLGGFQQLVRGEVIRGKFRDSFEKPQPFKPGKPAAVKFKLQDLYHTFRSGHKIMVQVQSTWFPLVDRNPQTFVDIYHAKESDFQKATQRVYRSGSRSSRLVAERLP
jgi:putative CocE/NonD family hydrolase